VKVLVTGGTGYLGRAVVSALAQAGHAPVVFSRRPDVLRTDAAFVTGDLRDAESVRSAMRGCDGVCHVAARVSIAGRPSEFDAVNVGGLQHVLDAARGLGIDRLVYTSSFLAHPPRGLARAIAANDYQRTKVLGLETARRAARSGQPIVVLSPGVIYGPGVTSEGNMVGRLLGDHLHHRLPGTVGPERIWSFAFVHDVARAHVAALERASARSEYALGGPNLPQQAAFEWLRAKTGRPLPWRIPYPLAHVAGWVDELRARLTGGLPRITRGAVEIFRHDWPLDSRDAESDLAYTMTPLERGLEAVWPTLSQGPQAGSAS
jgi:nucleoside-diphosphate-sugar epimerase